ncbi:hypothetical protein [Streptomyces sp. NPDC049881]|uniref:hypothetical protein n=1 Tax=Streptomyces sp. NPDC049881 TaxID=3155778 RepID=UPI00344315EF
MTTDESAGAEPEWISLSEAARRVVGEGIAPSMSQQRVSQLAREDPEFPRTMPIGRSTAVDWRQARAYFIRHAEAAAKRDRRRRRDP